MVLKIQIEGECYTCFSAILLDFIVNEGEKYHPQIFLKECKYAQKKITIMKNEELKLNESDNEYDYTFKCRDYILNCF